MLGLHLVNITWMGHACFALSGASKTVIFDPFKGIGIPEPATKADIVLCSHSHSDHNNAAKVKHESSIVMEGFTGRRMINGITISGVAVFHDDAQGGKRGRNSIYVVEMENLRFCHLGDLGHALSLPQVAEIGSVDVLFVPVGGFYTIGPDEARRTRDALKPAVTIPMHYKMAGMASTFDALHSIEDFLQKETNVSRLDGPAFSVMKVGLPKEPTTIVPKLL